MSAERVDALVWASGDLRRRAVPHGQPPPRDRERIEKRFSQAISETETPTPHQI